MVGTGATLGRVTMVETAQPADQLAPRDEALVITGADGSAYAIPLAALAQWRLSDAVAAQLHAQHEVSGYIIIGGYQALAVTHRSVLLGGSLTPAQVAACFPPIGTRS
jgi:hypothetical protein